MDQRPVAADDTPAAPAGQRLQALFAAHERALAAGDGPRMLRLERELLAAADAEARIASAAGTEG